MNICVFCSSSNAIGDDYFKDARELGRLIGEGKHTLINGGANVGLMETVTLSVRNTGARTVGVIPKIMLKRSLVSLTSHDVIITEDMMERKAKMREMSDAFIAMPGGFGTLEEVLEVITLRQLSYHTKPIVFINTNNFYEYLFKQFEMSYAKEFAKDVYRELYFIAKNPQEAMEYILNYKPVELDNKWFEVPGGNNK